MKCRQFTPLSSRNQQKNRYHNDNGFLFAHSKYMYFLRNDSIEAFGNKRCQSDLVATGTHSAEYTVANR